jgi:serine phosphatase RsbU (regulator of sigma subunit)
VDISTLGARLAQFEEPMKLGEIVEVRCGNRQAVFRVAWVGLPGTHTAGHAGLECLSPETNIWDLDLSTRTDDEPLLQEIAVARAVQRNLLPRQKPALRTLDYDGDCIQARSVGGDYYDFIDMGPGRVGFVLADVAGKGMAAALLMANLQGGIHVGSRSLEDLPRLLSSINDHLHKYTDPDRYATLFYGCYDDETGRITYINCGHSPPLLLRAGGAVERLAPTATVLGLFGQWECSLAETHMQAGDVLSVFSDGITETTGSDAEEFGESRLLEVLNQSRDLEAAAILRRVEQAVERFRASQFLQDDLTLVVARAH